MKEVIDFLTELSENNNREWFQQNKGRYQNLRAWHESLVEKIKNDIAEFDPLAASAQAKDCIFRIYRDVRFSKDKSPYKNHFGAYIAFGGAKSERAGYYLHISPGNSFMGGGIYQPSAELLKKIRTEIYFNAGEFKEIITTSAFTSEFNGLYEDKLTRPPKDFNADFKDIELLKYKSYFVDKPLSDKEILSVKLVNNLVKSYRVLAPLNAFLNKAFDQ